MAHVLLNAILRGDIEEVAIINWLRNSLKEYPNFNCNQTDFLFHFLNVIHEQIQQLETVESKNNDTCNENSVSSIMGASENDTQEESICLDEELESRKENDKRNNSYQNVSFQKLNNSLNITPVKSLDESQISMRGFNSTLDRSIEYDELLKKQQLNSSTPKMIKILSDSNTSSVNNTQLNSSYMSPISPIYKNDTSIGTSTSTNTGTTRNRRILTSSSTEKTSICLGDFIVNATTKNTTKKKLKFEKNVSRRRITPTSVSGVFEKSGISKSANSFDFKDNEKDLTGHIDQLRIADIERIKELTKKTTPDDSITRKLTFSQTKSEIEVDLNLVTNHLEIDKIINIYVTLLDNDLIPNKNAELHFVISLLLIKRFVASNEYLGVTALETSSKQNDVSMQEDINIKALFNNLHNVVYFASHVLKRQLHVIQNYDKMTLKVLCENSRLQMYVPDFLENLNRIIAVKSERLTQTGSLDINKNVCFDSDTDNREHFPNDASFHAFRKQRDLFYEILEIWEQNHLQPGWNFSIGLSGKIKLLFSLHGDPVNFMHFSRLFKAQLLGTHRMEEKSQLNSTLPNIDKEKLSRLRNRLITKCSTNGVHSPPAFTGNQEFYKEFIMTASNGVFNKHLYDALAFEILNLNDTNFLGTEHAEQENAVEPATRSSFVTCLESMKVLSKFLGFIESLPYISESVYNQMLINSHITIRRQMCPSFDIKNVLLEAVNAEKIILTIPWIAEYLSMLDCVTIRLAYYNEILSVLFGIYYNYKHNSDKAPNYNTSMIKFCLGWLFDLPHFPQDRYYSFRFSDIKRELLILSCKSEAGNKTDEEKGKSVSLDKLEIVDQNTLYICCPYLDEIRNQLTSHNFNRRSVNVKHITPVTALESTKEFSRKRMQLQLEETFFNGQPNSVRKTVEFVSERIASSCVKHICNSVVVASKKQAVEQYKRVVEELKITDQKSFNEKNSILKQWLMDLSMECLRELQRQCEEEVTTMVSSKLPATIEALLAPDTVVSVRKACISSATRMCYERVKHWILAHISESIFMKEFDKEIQIVIHSHEKSEKPEFMLPPSGCGKSHNANAPSAAQVLLELQLACVKLLRDKSDVDENFVLVLLKEILQSITERIDTDDCITASICQLLVDFALLLIAHKSFLVNDRILQLLVDIWNNYYDSKENLFNTLLCQRNIMILAQSDDVKLSWNVLAKFSAFLIKHEMLSCDNFESQCLGIFRTDLAEDSQENITVFLMKFLEYFKQCGGKSNTFTLILDFLSVYCSDL